MARSRLVVVKLGGSLLGWEEFPRRLDAYLGIARDEKIVIVVGGGRAADFIRALDSMHGIGEKRSHGLALRSLDLTAHIVAALVSDLTVVERPEALAEAWERGTIPVLAPRWFVETVDRRCGDPLPESWRVTTDSIAARVAEWLGAGELRLMKSTGLNEPLSRLAAAQTGLVDAAFPEVSRSVRKVAVVNLRATPPTTQYLD